MPSKLMTFALSHYCEIARWALDWHGIPFQEVGWPPGLHIVLARRLGARRSSLPILLAGDTLVQGSGAIIDWAERNATDADRSLAPADNPTEAEQLEQRADAVIGVHVRRMIYAELLARHSHVVRLGMLMNASPGHRLLGTLMWPVTRRLMISGMDARPAAAADSRIVLEAELDRLDRILSDGRAFLGGDRFSRADLVVASLLAPLARPRQAVVHADMTYPPSLEAVLDGWRGRPSMQWVNQLYDRHRQPAWFRSN